MIALGVGAVVLGGIRRIAKFSEMLVPAMCCLYIVASLYVLATRAALLPSVLAQIVTDAFTGSAVAGGALGTVIITGVKRAAFSNEAGIGTAPMAHGAAKTNEPVREGLVAMLGPFIDTIVVCTMTARSDPIQRARVPGGRRWRHAGGCVAHLACVRVGHGHHRHVGGHDFRDLVQFVHHVWLFVLRSQVPVVLDWAATWPVLQRGVRCHASRRCDVVGRQRDQHPRYSVRDDGAAKHDCNTNSGTQGDGGRADLFLKVRRSHRIARDQPTSSADFESYRRPKSRPQQNMEERPALVGCLFHG